MRFHLSRDEAIARLREEIGTMDGNDLKEVCRELFIPAADGPVSADEAAAMRRTILDRFDQGLVAEELEDTWNVVFPQHRRVQFDEEAEQLTYVVAAVRQ